MDQEPVWQRPVHDGGGTEEAEAPQHDADPAAGHEVRVSKRDHAAATEHKRENQESLQ